MLSGQVQEVHRLASAVIFNKQDLEQQLLETSEMRMKEVRKSVLFGLTYSVSFPVSVSVTPFYLAPTPPYLPLSVSYLQFLLPFHCN